MEKQLSAIIYRWYDRIKTREMRCLHLIVSRLPSLAVHSSDFTSQLCCIQVQPERNEGRKDLAVLFHKLHWGVSGLPFWEQRQCQYIRRETGFAAKTLSQKKFNRWLMDKNLTSGVVNINNERLWHHAKNQTWGIFYLKHPCVIVVFRLKAPAFSLFLHLLQGHLWP